MNDAPPPPTPQTSWAPIIFGGIFLGIWAYGLLFGFPDFHGFQPGVWFFWGLLGIVMAGGFYAARVASQGVLIAILVIVGMSIGMLILAAFLEEEAHIFATVVTVAGAGLIAAGIPAPRRNWIPVEEAPAQ